MSRPRVVLAVKLPSWFLRELERIGIEYYGYAVNGSCGPAEALVVPPAMSWSEVKRLLECSGARFLAVFGSGVDNLDLEYLEDQGVCVWNHPDHIADAVAEHAIALALALLRRVVAGDKLVRSGGWKSIPPRELLADTMIGSRVGIVGLGRIGSRIARLAYCLGASTPILYWSRRRKPEVERILPLRWTSLEELFSSSDIVFVSVALTEETRRLIGENLLSRMRGGYLVNVSRGQVVDTQALIKAIREGWVRGAALDVYEEEPLPPNHPLVGMEQVILSPHIGGYTRRAMEETARWLLEELKKVLVEGKQPTYPLTRACRRD